MRIIFLFFVRVSIDFVELQLAGFFFFLKKYCYSLLITMIQKTGDVLTVSICVKAQKLFIHLSESQAALYP